MSARSQTKPVFKEEVQIEYKDTRNGNRWWQGEVRYLEEDEHEDGYVGWVIFCHDDYAIDFGPFDTLSELYNDMAADTSWEYRIGT